MSELELIISSGAATGVAALLCLLILLSVRPGRKREDYEQK